MTLFFAVPSMLHIRHVLKPCGLLQCRPLGCHKIPSKSRLIILPVIWSARIYLPHSPVSFYVERTRINPSCHWVCGFAQSRSDGEQQIARRPIRTKPMSTARCVPSASQGAVNTAGARYRAKCLPGSRDLFKHTAQLGNQGNLRTMQGC